MKEKEYIYFRENLIQSIIADCVGWGFIIGGLLLNRYFLGDKDYIGFVFIICFFLFIIGQSFGRQKRFKNLQEFKEYVAKL